MEGSVGADGDARGDGDAWCHVGGAGVEFLRGGRDVRWVVWEGRGRGREKGWKAGRAMYFTEIYRFHSFASECWTDGWTGCCLSGADDQLDDLICCLFGARHFGGGLVAWECNWDSKAGAST